MILTRGGALLVRAFYLLTGLCSFLTPGAFYDSVANFAPYNVHLLHDLGAFQVGLGLALVLPAALGRALVTSLAAVLGASDLPILALVRLLLLVAIVAEGRQPRRPAGQS
jgi:hypothetical protein